jgi:RNA polymerase sigma factor (sigma-70 family)
MASSDEHSLDPVGDAVSMEEDVRRAAEVFQRYGKEIRCFVELQARDEAEADDLFQEFFLSLVRSRMPQNITSMKRYLYRAIANDLMSRMRTYRRYQRRLRAYAEMRQQQQHQDDPDKHTVRAEQARRVFELIERHLPPREAEAVTCRFRKDWSNGEVAEHMGVDRRSVTRYLCAGIKRIKEIGLMRERKPL